MDKLPIDDGGPGFPGTDSPVRTFFSLRPDEVARTRLATLAGDIARKSRGRAVISEHVHLTLAFIGDVPVESIESLCAVAASVPLEGAVLEFDVLGSWRASGVAWVAPSVIAPQIAALHDRLVEALALAGFTVDTRPFRPHVTLARRCVLPPARGRCAPIHWHVDQLALVGSVLRPEGPSHRELRAWPLPIAPAGATGR